MKTFNCICIQDHTVTDKSGNSFTVNRGKEYLTSEEYKGRVCVLSSYWVWLPSDLFVAPILFTK
jgi:hypothetical protein